MSPLEALLAASDEEVLVLVRQMTGKKEMALAIAKTFSVCIGSKLNVSAVAEAFEIEVPSAYEKIKNASVLGTVNPKDSRKTP
jgi:hypothetical protein